MKFSALAVCISGALFASLATAKDYSREDLELKSKSELVEIVLNLENGHDNCKVFSPFSGERSTFLTYLDRPGYPDDGTLKYPNGQIFMRRNLGASDDYTIYYPNGQVFQARYKGYSSDLTTFWPSGWMMLQKHVGYDDHGSIFRADGSSWLRRHVGHEDDRQRYGQPTEFYSGDRFNVSAQLTPSDSVIATLLFGGADWHIVVVLRGEDNSVVVRECSDPIRS